MGVDRAHDAVLVSCGATVPFITALALTLTRWRISHLALAFVSALGRCALLTFLLHRIVEQILNLGLQPLDAPREP